VQAHTHDLRAEVQADWTTLSAAPLPDEAGLDAFVHAVVDDWRQTPLTDAVGVLLEFAEKVTHRSADCSAADVARLRSAGWSDAAIHDAVQVIAYFNYINRMADALGVEEESDLPHWGGTRPH
jgi:uncharacterized peroxidase-related enzyme